MDDHPPARPGYSLARPFYTDPAIFDQDLEILWRHWFLAGHAHGLAQPGDWISAALGRDGALVVRGQDGVLRGFANLCRHRGSRLCEGAGRAARLVCPYHGWSYGLDGALLRAMEMPDGFQAEAHGLIALPVAEVAGLVFVSFSPDPPAIGAAAAALAPLATRFGWQDARIAAQRSYPVAANWKLVLENYHECYHCGPAHPEFSACHMLAAPGSRRLGPGDQESWPAEPDGQEVFRLLHSALIAGALSGSRDGGLLAPIMGQAAPGHCVFAELGLLTACLAYADHGVLYRFRPISVRETVMDVFWLVAGTAEPGRDYDEAALTWLWDVTSLADKRIIERNQAGVESRHYQPGPYSLMEPATRQFSERYFGEWRAPVRV